MGHTKFSCHLPVPSDLCRGAGSRWFIGVRPTVCIRRKHTNVWLCEWRALHRNGDPSLACQGKMTLPKNHTAVFPRAVLPSWRAFCPGRGADTRLVQRLTLLQAVRGGGSGAGVSLPLFLAGLVSLPWGMGSAALACRWGVTTRGPHPAEAHCGGRGNGFCPRATQVCL